MKITVFTPSYNRAYILPQLYASLQRQSFTDFEWLVVDDGSTDNTGELVAQWQGEDNPFSIRYFRQENGGKHRAMNRGLELARGELFFVMDSDDYCTDWALERIAHWGESLKQAGGFCGLEGQKGISATETPNSRIPGGCFDGNALNHYSDYGGPYVDGERAQIYFTEIHRNYKYPEIPGERFMTEAVTTNRMARDGYKIRYVDEIYAVCRYREDGLTKAGFRLFLNNPRGYVLWVREKDALIHGTRRSAWWTGYSLFCDLRQVLSMAELREILQISAPELASYRLCKVLRGAVGGLKKALKK